MIEPRLSPVREPTTVGSQTEPSGRQHPRGIASGWTLGGRHQAHRTAGTRPFLEDEARARGASRPVSKSGLYDGLRVDGPLTASTVLPFFRTVRAYLEAGADRLCLDLQAVKTVDVVGLAALVQCADLGALFGAGVSIVPSPEVHRALLEAELLGELPFGAPPSAPFYVSVPSWEAEPPDPPTPLLARTARLGLRLPSWDELRLFERWANDPFLDQMVGSELLYRCRHVGPYHPEFVSHVVNSGTSLTLLVQPLGSPAPPVGFVRLYTIRLVEGFGFLETAVADMHSLRKGWGIQASRLFLAYAMDVLRIRRVEAKVYAYNVLSINSLKRNGFCQEGVLRQARTYGGQRWDILVFSILEDEMAEQRKQDRFPYMGFWE